MQAYSLDLRERVVAAYEKGRTTISAVAGQFSIGETFVKKMLRQTGLMINIVFVSNAVNQGRKTLRLLTIIRVLSISKIHR